MGNWQSLSAAWRDTLLGASVQGALGIMAVLALVALFPRLSGAARAWLWRLAFARVLIGLFWAAPLPLPLHTEPAPPAPLVVQVEAPEAEAPAPVLDTPAPVQGPGLLEVTATLWVLGSAWCVWRGYRQFRAARRLRDHARTVSDERVLRNWEETLAAFALRRAPELREAEGLPSPLLVQANGPVVIVPAGLADHWSADQMRLMFGHELAHLRRHDLLWGWLPAVAHTVFFFHPLVWLANREWRLAHDMAADELALRTSELSAAEYARMLVRLAVFPRPEAVGAETAGLALMDARESARTLERRLKAMTRLVHPNPRERWATWAPALLLGVLILVPSRVAAGGASPVPASDRLTESRPVPRPDTTRSSDPVPAREAKSRNADPTRDATRAADRVRVAGRTDPAAGSDVAVPRLRRDERSEKEGDRIRSLQERLRAVERQLDQLVEQNRQLQAVQKELERALAQSRGGDGRTPTNRRESDSRPGGTNDLDRPVDLGLSVPRADVLRRRTEGYDRADEAPPIQYLVTVRQLRQVDGEERTLANSKLVMIEGTWVRIEVPTGKQLPGGEGDLGRGGLLLRISRDDRTNRLLIETRQPGDRGPQLLVVQPGHTAVIERNVDGRLFRTEITAERITTKRQ